MFKENPQKFDAVSKAVDILLDQETSLPKTVVELEEIKKNLD